MTGVLDGQIAIVTGAGRGIGAAIADRLAADGATVVRADLSEGDFTGDLSNEEVAGQLIADTINANGRIDILVNNAGGGVILPFLSHTPETLRTTVDRNLWTAIWCCWHVLPHMKALNYGRVINIGADSVRNGLVDHAGYNAAKGGMHAMTTGLAREFAPFNITVNTVAPCVVETDVVREYRKTRPELIDAVTQIIPLGRPAAESEVAGMVAYLAGPDGGFVTGQVLSLNGGTAML
jgi:2,3-dihydroxy-2,3-dihydro-p-cumate dehydrogenase